MQPVIMHLDMNSYFASVEQQDNLAWRGKPVGVCEHLGGIIIAASVEAKRWGIKTGTPVWEARRLYPKIFLTPTHPDRYRLYTKRVIKLVSDYTALVEQASIDEVFLDLTKECNVKIFRRHSGSRMHLRGEESRPRLRSFARMHSLRMTPEMANPFEEAVSIAQEIKRRMKTEVGDWLRCSVGIAENKLLAKIASDLKKPDGIVVVKSEKFKGESAGAGLARPVHNQRAAKAGLYNSNCIILSKNDLYQKLKLTDIPGIGRRMEKNLNALGIKTLPDLKNYPESLLAARFGIQGRHLHAMGQLEATWKPAVLADNTIKSIGHMYTLPREFREQKFFLPVLYKLCEMVARRLRRQNLTGDIIHFYFYDQDYGGFGKSEKLGYFTQDGREIFLQCVRMVGGVGNGLKPFPTRECKSIGITVAGLRPYVRQLSLFGGAERQKSLLAALDKINAKYGEFTVCRAPVLAAAGAFKDSIGFGRIKEL